MKYYFKFNTGFLREISVCILWLVVCLLQIIKLRRGNLFSFDFYFYLTLGVFWFLMTTVVFLRGYAVVRFALKKQPLLEVNEIWLCDYVRGKKFYWDDIEEVINDKDVLEVKVYNPEPYLSAPKGGIRRLFFKRESKKVFKIDLNCVKVNSENLTNTLNDFSIKAMELKAENN